MISLAMYSYWSSWTPQGAIAYSQRYTPHVSDATVCSPVHHALVSTSEDMAEVLTLNFALPPCACSRCEANAELSLSNENPDTLKLSNGEAKTGVEREAEYADFVFVPSDA